MNPITNEYLNKILERAKKAQPNGLKADKDCTCAQCARVVLLNEVIYLKNIIKNGFKKINP